MKSIWQEESRRELSARVGALAWDRQASWGKFTAPKMVCHLADSLRMAMGDLKVARKTLADSLPATEAADHLLGAVSQARPPP
jgi:hypothetical protein